MFYGGFVYGMTSNASNCNTSGTAPCTPARYYRIGSMKLAKESAPHDTRKNCAELVES